MGTTVQQLFYNVGIAEFDSVKWETPINIFGQGVYLISTSSNPNKNKKVDYPVFDTEKINAWIKKVPNFQVDNLTSTLETVRSRLDNFWIPDENILYIGKAPYRSKGKKAISRRVHEYYTTELGNKGPHRGGHWLKTLTNLQDLTVYFAITDNPKTVEDHMLDYFQSHVSSKCISNLYDKTLPLPFANIKHKGKCKRHGFNKQAI